MRLAVFPASLVIHGEPEIVRIAAERIHINEVERPVSMQIVKDQGRDQLV